MSDCVFEGGGVINFSTQKLLRVRLSLREQSSSSKVNFVQFVFPPLQLSKGTSKLSALSTTNWLASSIQCNLIYINQSPLDWVLCGTFLWYYSEMFRCPVQSLVWAGRWDAEMQIGRWHQKLLLYHATPNSKGTHSCRCMLCVFTIHGAVVRVGPTAI